MAAAGRALPGKENSRGGSRNVEEALPTGRFVVGLGNPERRYRGTRHNTGFMVLSELRRRWGFGRGRSKFHGRCWSGSIAGRSVTLLAPETYMNRSGLAVAEMMAFYKAAPDGVLLVMDDMALPPGRLRARADGSPGGHRGLADILQAAGTEALPRLRIGIGPPPAGVDPVDYVLSEFAEAERPVMLEAVQRAAAAVEDWAARGITYVMNHYNQDTTAVGNSKEDGKHS